MSLLYTLDAMEEGTAARRLIDSAVSLLMRTNSVSSQRGSKRISSTKDRVASKFRLSVVTSTLMDCLPVNILIEEPNASMASSSSMGVLLAVPSIIISVMRFATPILLGSSKSIPPLISIPKLIKGNSSSLAP